MTHDVAVYALAEKVLANAPQAFIDTLADALQRDCDDHLQEFEAWRDEQRILKGLTDAERERV